MKSQAYVKDGLLCMYFHQSSIMLNEMKYQLGSALADYSMLSESLIRNIFDKFRHEFLVSIQNKETDDYCLNKLQQYFQALSHINPYLNFYMENHVAFLMYLRMQKSEIFEVLQSFLYESDNINFDDVDFADMSNSSQWAVDTFVDDIKNRQARLKEDFDAITGGQDDLAELTPMQRLYMLSKQGRNYLSGEFKTALSPDYLNMPEDDDIAKIKSTLIDNKVDIVEMVEINNLDDLICFEMYHTLKSDLLLRKCKYCGEYFIVSGRIDIEYCNRIKDGETKPCSIIGATRSYWSSKEGDPIYAEFQQAYKRNHSRRRVGKMTPNEFYEWSEEARRKRSECEDGQLTIEDFRAWLGNKK